MRLSNLVRAGYIIWGVGHVLPIFEFSSDWMVLLHSKWIQLEWLSPCFRGLSGCVRTLFFQIGSSRVASARRGKVKEPSRFLSFLPDFSSSFPIVLDFSPLFPDFWEKNFAGRGATLPPVPPSGYATYWEESVGVGLQRGAGGSFWRMIIDTTKLC